MYMKQFKSEDKGHNKKNNKESGNRRKWICGILAVLLLLVLIWLLHSCRAEPVHEFFDPSARTGTLPGRSEKEIQGELNKVVEEGMFNISIASVVTVDENGADAMARIENIAANHHHMKVTITLDGEREPIYESAGIAPGQYIEHVKLNRTLSAGTYSATALFTAYDMENLLQAGQAAAKITIVAGS